MSVEVWSIARADSPCAACKRKQARQPEGYVEWHAWAERKSRTHRQVQCPECGYFVWVKKSKVPEE